MRLGVVNAQKHSITQAKLLGCRKKILAIGFLPSLYITSSVDLKVDGASIRINAKRCQWVIVRDMVRFEYYRLNTLFISLSDGFCY